MAKWDPGRFLNTVGYFGAIPIFSDVQRWLMGESKDRTSTDGGRALGLVLVVGAVSEIGQLVVEQLVKSGYRVRAAISDLSLTPFSVPANVEYVQVDSNSLNLSAQIMAGVRSIIICPDPQNFLPSAVLTNLMAAASTYLTPVTKLELFDFTQPDTNLQTTWGAVDDVVMGGVSESGIRLADGYALFSGNVSTDNSGGFASVRTRNFEPSFNLSNYRGIELRVKGDGQRYKLFVRTETRWDGVGYAYSFDTIADQWITIQVPFQDLVPIFRAKTVNDAPLDTTQICSLQLMLSKFEYDKALNPRFTPGLFSIQVESISAYGGQNLPQLVVINLIPLPTELVPNLQATNLPYSIVQAGNLDSQMVAIIAVKSLSQPEAVGQIFGY
jgi:Complex I intermediate-associated protein 30 (CIA30)